MTTITLKDASQKYLEHLKAIGKKPSTIGTATRTLDLLIADMGETKEVGKILAVHVDRFFKSEAATMQKGRDGLKPRAKASILQIRRIVRMALVHWREQGIIAKAPLPGDEKRLVEKAEKRATEKKHVDTREAKQKRKPKARIETTSKPADTSEPQEDDAPANGDA